MLCSIYNLGEGWYWHMWYLWYRKVHPWFWQCCHWHHVNICHVMEQLLDWICFSIKTTPTFWSVLTLLFFLLLIICILVAARAARTYLLIISDWDWLVNIGEYAGAARIIHMAMQFLVLIVSFYCMWLHSISAVVFHEYLLLFSLYFTPLNELERE